MPTGDGLKPPSCQETTTSVLGAMLEQKGAQLTESGILEAVRSRLARYKLPKRILLVSELPRNTMGKVQKNVLRATNDSLYMR